MRASASCTTHQTRATAAAAAELSCETTMLGYVRRTSHRLEDREQLADRLHTTHRRRIGQLLLLNSLASDDDDDDEDQSLHAHALCKQAFGYACARFGCLILLEPPCCRRRCCCCCCKFKLARCEQVCAPVSAILAARVLRLRLCVCVCVLVCTLHLNKQSAGKLPISARAPIQYPIQEQVRASFWILSRAHCESVSRLCVCDLSSSSSTT